MTRKEKSIGRVNPLNVCPENLFLIFPQYPLRTEAKESPTKQKASDTLLYSTGLQGRRLTIVVDAVDAEGYRQSSLLLIDSIRTKLNSALTHFPSKSAVQPVS